MMPPRFVDTNILLYSISDDPRERAKRDIAVELLEQDDKALSVQALQEFYVQATRAKRPNPLSHEIAAGLVGTWLLRFPVQDITAAVLRGALDIRQETGLSYWDAAIISAARALGCRELLSEDMAHGREIDGVRIVNPFR
jgi:predicted nucleic acid-binding protein